MSAYIDTCDECLRCEGCNRQWCPSEEVSPGEADGICRRCYETEDDNQGETE